MSSDLDEIKSLLKEIKSEVQSTKHLVQALAKSSGISDDEIKKHVMEFETRTGMTDPKPVEVDPER